MHLKLSPTKFEPFKISFEQPEPSILSSEGYSIKITEENPNLFIPGRFVGV